MTNWVRGKDTYNATLENIRAATLELALFPPQIFNYYSQKIREAANTSGVHYVPLSQAEALMATILEERYFSNTVSSI
jgi:S-adenosylmethionine synthetase